MKYGTTRDDDPLNLKEIDLCEECAEKTNLHFQMLK